MADWLAEDTMVADWLAEDTMVAGWIGGQEYVKIGYVSAGYFENPEEVEWTRVENG